MRRRRDLKLCGLALLVMAMFAALHLAAPDLRWLRLLELYAFDLGIRMRGTSAAPTDVVLVMIDDATVAELGRWPVPRRLLADAVRTAHRAGAKAIGLDILFAEPERGRAAEEDAGDAALGDAIRAAGNVVLPFTFRFGAAPAATDAGPVARAAFARVRDGGADHTFALAPSSVISPVPALAEAAELGHALVAYDVDGEARYEYPALPYDLDYYPSMAVRLAALYLGVPWSEVTLELGRGIALGPVYVPTDRQMRLLVDYRGPPATFATYSLSGLLSGAVGEASLRGRVVLIGANALGSRDSFVTPFTSVMPGVERLATVVDSIISGHHLRRPDAAPWLEIAGMLAASAALGLAVSRLRLAVAVGVALITLLPAASAQLMLERYGIWQASAVPSAALALTFAALALYRHGLLDREHRHIRRVFQRYLSPAMVEQLADTAKLPELGGERRDLSILFCDLRGFTALAESTEPAAMTRLANDFLSAASEAILKEDGTIDKFMGDAIMAFWNAPVEQPDHAARACRAALGIVDNLAVMNEGRRRESGSMPLAIGIGINTGACIVGNFGSRQRFDYSAVGDAVNIASRLQTETKRSGWAILLGAETVARAGDLATLPLGPVELRGRSLQVEAYALIGDRALAASAPFRALRAEWSAGRDERAPALLARLEGEDPRLKALWRPLGPASIAEARPAKA
jgi:adenylate cyclase